MADALLEAAEARGRLGSVVRTQFPYDVVQMDFHSIFRQPEFGSNQLVLQAAGDPFENLQFASSEFRDIGLVVVNRAGHSTGPERKC